MIRTSEQVNELFAALAKAQAEIENVAKDRENPHFRAKYATLAGVLDEVRPKLAKHGIALYQAAVNGEGSSVGAVTRLAHSSGQWVESEFYVIPTKTDAQGAGSALTYCRRYSLMAVAGVAPEDDDGEAAVARPQAPRAGMVRAPDARPGTAERERLWIGINKAALAAGPEDDASTIAARKRIRELIDKYDAIIKNAPHRQALELSLDDARDELAEIEAAGPKGKEAAMALRRKAKARFEQFAEAAE